VSVLVSFNVEMKLFVLSCSLQTFESPVSFHNADVGRCVANELFNVTDATGATATTDVPTFTVVLTHPEPSWTTTTRPTGPTRVTNYTYSCCRYFCSGA